MCSCGWIMEDSQESRGWIYRNRKLVAGLMVIFVLFQVTTVVINIVNPRDTNDWIPDYSLTVWILPDLEEFHLHLDFYSSEQNAYQKIDRFFGRSIRVEPLDDEKNVGPVYFLPENLLSVWVKIYFDQDTEEPFIIMHLELQQKITTTLLGREISILWEPYHGE
jgi:hypothetical protein